MTLKYIHEPVNNFKKNFYPKGDITQFFGENVAMYQKAIGTNGHNGIDIVRPHGSPIYAVEDGIVADVKNDATGYGKHCRILSFDEDKKTGREWTYGHASSNLVQQNQEVKAGQIIQLMGNTGFVVSSQNANGFWKYNPYAGTHLHLGCRLWKKGGWSYPGSDIRITILNYLNGFKGAIDFADMLPTTNNTTDEEMAELKKIFDSYTPSMKGRLVFLWKKLTK